MLQAPGTQTRPARGSAEQGGRGEVCIGSGPGFKLPNSGSSLPLEGASVTAQSVTCLLSSVLPRKGPRLWGPTLSSAASSTSKPGWVCKPTLTST